MHAYTVNEDTNPAWGLEINNSDGSDYNGVCFVYVSVFRLSFLNISHVIDTHTHMYTCSYGHESTLPEPVWPSGPRRRQCQWLLVAQ